MAWTICFVWCDEAPCIGRSETISYLPLPTGAAQVDELTGVAPPPPPPLPPLPPLLPLLLLAAAGGHGERERDGRDHHGAASKHFS